MRIMQAGTPAPRPHVSEGTVTRYGDVTLLVGPGDEQGLALEVAQPLREDVRRDPLHVSEHLVEAARPLEERVDDEQRPAVADALESLG